MHESVVIVRRGGEVSWIVNRGMAGSSTCMAFL